MLQPIRVYVVEDHVVMRESLENYLASFPDIELCGTAGCAEDALVGIEAAVPSLVLLDLSLPGRSGIDVLEETRSRFGIPCIILSGHHEKAHVERAFEAGARGYVLKGSPRELPIAIRRVASGDSFLSKALRPL